MIRTYVYDIIRFFVLILVQVMIMDNIQFSGYVNPFFYVLFILLLPFETPGWLLLLYGSILGFSMDFLTGQSGIHASATVFLAFVRPFVLKNIAPHEGYESTTLPRISYYGIYWFAKYTFLLVLAHSVFIFTVESFDFSHLFHILTRIILSTLLTGTLIILSQFFIFRR